MLLRTITKHVKEQNWFAVFLDFFIVVVGILIAFQITNWNEARGEANLQSLVEKRLIADFQFIDQELDAAVERMERQMMDVEILRQAIKRGVEGPNEEKSILHALSRGFSYPSFAQRSSTYQELQTSGQLDLISNEKFRVVLSQYDDATQQRRFNLSAIRDGMLPSARSFRDYVKFAPLERDEAGEVQILPVIGYDFNGMASDDAFLANLEDALHLQTWIHSNVRWARRDADAVLAVIKEIQ